jgi:hypothetical protein
MIAAGEVKTVLVALDIAADYQRDHARRCTAAPAAKTSAGSAGTSALPASRPTGCGSPR